LKWPTTGIWRFPIELVLAGYKCKNSSWLWPVPLWGANCPGSITNWLQCTGRVLPLTLGEPAVLHKNLIHQRGYKYRQKTNNNTQNSHIWSCDNHHIFTETHLQSLFLLGCQYLMWCHWKPSHCTWKALDIQALPPTSWKMSCQWCSPPHQVKMWLQQDCAPPHFGRKVTVLLNRHFQNH